MHEEEIQGLIRREFLGWLCKIGGGVTALTLGPGLLPLRRVNTVLFGGTAHAQEPCTNDVCTTRDSCESGDAGHTCQVQDVCDVDESGDCTGDRCVQDTSGPCTNDGGPACPEDETCPEDTCAQDYAGLCEEDSSSACTNDACRADSSGTCANDRCTADISGGCTQSDTCTADSSGGCAYDTCTVDSSGMCSTDECSSDSSQSCATDYCVSDSSGGCMQSDTCTTDSSGECMQSDTCAADSSGECTQSDTCTADSSGECTHDTCTADSSGECTQSDRCYYDQSGGCTNRDRCNSDYSGECSLDVCVLDGSNSCSNDLCREDRSPSGCRGGDTCTLDLSFNSRVNRRNFARAAINQAIKTLYHMVTVILFLALAYGQSEAATVINATDAVFSDTPAYVTAGSVAVPSPVGPFLRDCDGDGILEADTNGDGSCEGDPEVRDYDGDGSRELPEGTSFTGDFQFTCFYIPSDVTIKATGPLTIRVSTEAAVFGAVRLASGIQLSCLDVIDLRTSSWLSEDGSEIRFTTALAGEIDETQNYYTEGESVPAIEFSSACQGFPQTETIPVLSEWGMILFFLLIAAAVVVFMRKKQKHGCIM